MNPVKRYAINEFKKRAVPLAIASFIAGALIMDKFHKQLKGGRR